MSQSIEALRPLLQTRLPDFNRLRAAALELAGQVSIGQSAFLQKFGIASELEYKRQAMRDGQIMYHAHIGMNDIDTTAAALGKIHRELGDREYRLDRAGFCRRRYFSCHHANAAA